VEPGGRERSSRPPGEGQGGVLRRQRRRAVEHADGKGGASRAERVDPQEVEARRVCSGRVGSRRRARELAEEVRSGGSRILLAGMPLKFFSANNMINK